MSWPDAAVAIVGMIIGLGVALALLTNFWDNLTRR